MTPTAPALVCLLHSRRFSLSDEKAVQGEIAQALEADGIAAEREHRLSARDIPDFWIPETGVAIEVKVKGARRADIARQLERYAGHGQVKALVLVTGVSMRLPFTIGGKPVFYVSLGRAWL